MIERLKRVELPKLDTTVTRASHNHVWADERAAAQYDAELVERAVRALFEVNLDECRAETLEVRLALADHAIEEACSIAEQIVTSQPSMTRPGGEAVSGWMRLLPLSMQRRKFAVNPVAVIRHLRGLVSNWKAVMYLSLMGIFAGLAQEWPQQQQQQSGTCKKNAKSWRDCREQAMLEIEADIESGRMTVVEQPSTEMPRVEPVVSMLAARPKPDGTVRTIVDASMKREHGKMTGPNAVVNTRLIAFPSMMDLRAFAKQYSWARRDTPDIAKDAHMVVGDLKRAFRSLALGVASYPAGRISDETRILQDRAAMMGAIASVTPMARTSNAIMNALKAEFGHNLICCGSFIDDLCIMARTKDKAVMAFERLQELVRSLNLTLSANKVQAPTTDAVYLGMRVWRTDSDSEEWRVELTDEKRAKLIDQLERAGSGLRLSRSDCAALAGRIQHCATLGPEAVLASHALLTHLYARAAGDARSRRALPSPAREAAQRTAGMLHKNLCRAVPLSWLDNTVAADVHAYIDASGSGFGGVVLSRPTDKPRERPRVYVYMGRWPRAQRVSVIAEWLSFMVLVLTFAHRFRSRRVRVWSDNVSVVCTARGTKVSRVRDERVAGLTATLANVCLTSGMRLQLSHIAGDENQAADVLSRWWTRPGPTPKQDEVRRDIATQIPAGSPEPCWDERWSSCAAWLKKRGVPWRATQAALRRVKVVDPERWKTLLWPCTGPSRVQAVETN